MTNSNAIYKDIKTLLDRITLDEENGGANNIHIGLVQDVGYLPKKKPKLYVWFINSGNEGKLILDALLDNYKIDADNGNIKGQYLYVYETTYHIPHI